LLEIFTLVSDYSSKTLKNIHTTHVIKGENKFNTRDNNHHETHMTNYTKPIVAIAESKGHYDGTLKALKLVEDKIIEGIKGKRKVLIKPNFVSTSVQLAATHVDSVRAVLEIIARHYDGELALGEGPSIGSLEDAITNFGYDSLIEEYNMKVVDLNRDKFIELDGVDSVLKPMKFRVSETILDSNYLISVARPKTHDTVIATLSIKNVVVGSLVTVAEKERIHQGYRGINFNIARLGQRCMPDLAVIDGFVGMEGDGPVGGTPVHLGVSSASIHPVSLDAVMAKVMGFEPLDIGYLHYLDEWGAGIARLGEVEVVGKSIAEVSKRFKPHSTYIEQLNWR
jgi:uncharacterized protein (DUF362 family)